MHKVQYIIDRYVALHIVVGFTNVIIMEQDYTARNFFKGVLLLPHFFGGNMINSIYNFSSPSSIYLNDPLYYSFVFNCLLHIYFSRNSNCYRMDIKNNKFKSRCVYNFNSRIFTLSIFYLGEDLRRVLEKKDPSENTMALIDLKITAYFLLYSCYCNFPSKTTLHNLDFSSHSSIYLNDRFHTWQYTIHLFLIVCYIFISLEIQIVTVREEYVFPLYSSVPIRILPVANKLSSTIPSYPQLASSNGLSDADKNPRPTEGDVHDATSTTLGYTKKFISSSPSLLDCARLGFIYVTLWNIAHQNVCMRGNTLLPSGNTMDLIDKLIKEGQLTAFVPSMRENNSCFVTTNSFGHCSLRAMIYLREIIGANCENNMKRHIDKSVRTFGITTGLSFTIFNYIPVVKLRFILEHPLSCPVINFSYYVPCRGFVRVEFNLSESIFLGGGIDMRKRGAHGIYCIIMAFEIKNKTLFLSFTTDTCKLICIYIYIYTCLFTSCWLSCPHLLRSDLVFFSFFYYIFIPVWYQLGFLIIRSGIIGDIMADA
uniref:LAGLIDADG_2 domain-containing protein n=1 Tax=Heterorhabditis bacteriophora TaxID=37862 RepID=A0A1I7W9X3_HETBA